MGGLEGKVGIHFLTHSPGGRGFQAAQSACGRDWARLLCDQQTCNAVNWLTKRAKVSSLFKRCFETDQESFRAQPSRGEKEGRVKERGRESGEGRIGHERAGGTQQPELSCCRLTPLQREVPE